MSKVFDKLDGTTHSSTIALEFFHAISAVKGTESF
jgi:hypothetical protein